MRETLSRARDTAAHGTLSAAQHLGILAVEGFDFRHCSLRFFEQFLFRGHFLSALLYDLVALIFALKPFLKFTFYFGGRRRGRAGKTWLGLRGLGCWFRVADDSLAEKNGDKKKGCDDHHGARLKGRAESGS